ncbi:hypothetical protein quinque_011417 [Culex quinquefasciatus]
MIQSNVEQHVKSTATAALSVQQGATGGRVITFAIVVVVPYGELLTAGRISIRREGSPVSAINTLRAD